MQLYQFSNIAVNNPQSGCLQKLRGRFVRIATLLPMKSLARRRLLKGTVKSCPLLCSNKGTLTASVFLKCPPI